MHQSQNTYLYIFGGIAFLRTWNPKMESALGIRLLLYNDKKTTKN